MRLTIATRVFLAVTAASFLTLLLTSAATRWNIQRGFLDYVGVQETEQLTGAVATLESIFREDGNWQRLQGNDRLWRDILGSGSRRGPGRHGGRRPPPPGVGKSRPGGERPPPPRAGPPPGDPLDIANRSALIDPAGNVIVGRFDDSERSRRLAIDVDGETVAFAVIRPPRQLLNELDRQFSGNLDRFILWVSAAALGMAALVAWLLARQLTRPIQTLAAGAQKIASGEYGGRMNIRRQDELGDLAREFDRLSDALAKNRESRQQWVADIAHELRTPLSVLRGELDAIEDGVRPFNDQTRRSLNAEVSRLTRLVEDLHLLSSSDEGGLDYRRERFDAVAFFQATFDLAEARIRDAGLTLRRDFPDGTADVDGDPARLGQLLSNLIENAIRYTDAPGTVSVSCAVVDERVVLQIEDSAPSVPAERIDRLFERLYRVDESRSRNTGGSGLGLSICKAIVDAHGGDIIASASVLGGLCIKVGLPLAGKAAVRQ